MSDSVCFLGSANCNKVAFDRKSHLVSVSEGMAGALLKEQCLLPVREILLSRRWSPCSAWKPNVAPLTQAEGAAQLTPRLPPKQPLQLLWPSLNPP